VDQAELKQRVKANVDTWSRENAAFLESLRHEPHPLRTIKIQKKRWGTFITMIHRTGAAGEFISFRSAMMLKGMPQVACADLTFLVGDDPRVFIIEPDLGNLLRKTGLRGAEVSMLHLPFRTIYLQLPKNDIPVLASVDDVGTLEGIYMTEEEAEEDGRKLLLLLAVGTKKDCPITDDCLFTTPFFLNVDEPVEPQVLARIDDVKQRKLGAELENLEYTREIFTWAINCLLYINSSGADTKEEWLNRSAAEKMRKATGPKKAKIRHMLETTSTRVIRVGASVRMSHEDLGGTHRSPTLHWVRGFWRWQVCGAGRAERKHKWIRPFLRGEGRDIVSRMYKVGKGETDGTAPVPETSPLQNDSGNADQGGPVVLPPEDGDRQG
jgi:hypothetical protein